MWLIEDRVKSKLVVSWTAVVAVVVCLMPPLSEAAGPEDLSPTYRMERHEGGPGRVLERLARILELTEEQKAKIKETLEQVQAQNAPLQEKLSENGEKTAAAMAAEPLDEAAVRAAAENHALILGELLVAGARGRSEVRAVLTPGQRELADRLRPLLFEGFGPHGIGPGVKVNMIFGF